MIITHRYFARFFLVKVLQLHNLCYQLAGLLSQRVEPDNLHPKHRLMDYHDWFARRLNKDWHVLDIGCGNGALAFDIKAACRTVTGIDINAANIETAQKKYSKQGISYICSDVLTHRFNQHFQAVILSNVLEHIDNRVAFLKQLYANQSQADPPVLLLRVPMMTRDWITLYKKELGIEWRLDPSHFTEYTLDQVSKEMEAAGLQIESFDVQFGEFYGVAKKI